MVELPLDSEETVVKHPAVELEKGEIESINVCAGEKSCPTDDIQVDECTLDYEVIVVKSPAESAGAKLTALADNLAIVPVLSHEGEKAWKEFFCPSSADAPSITVPAPWVDFFTAKLLSPADFEWAKAILQSKLWDILQEGSEEALSRKFVIPHSCPTSSPPTCTLSAASLEVTQGFSTPQAPRHSNLIAAHELFSTSVLHIRKKQKKTPLVTTHVRRSERIKLVNQGHKGKTCIDKHYLACSAEAPPLNKKIVQNLSNKFGVADAQIPSPLKGKKTTKPKNKDVMKTKQPPKKK